MRLVAQVNGEMIHTQKLFRRKFYLITQLISNVKLSKRAFPVRQTADSTSNSLSQNVLRSVNFCLPKYHEFKSRMR